MSILLKQYTRYYDSSSISCTFDNNKTLIYNKLQPEFNTFVYIPQCRDNIIGTFDYHDWQVEIHNKYIVYYNDKLNINITTLCNKIYIKLYNTDIIIYKLLNKVSICINDNITNTSNTTTETLAHNITINMFNIYEQDGNIGIRHIMNDIIIFGKYYSSIDNLTIHYSLNNNYYITYENIEITNDVIYIYNSLFEYYFCSQCEDPFLVVNNKKSMSVLSYTDIREEYYINSNKENSYFFLLADISYMLYDDHNERFKFIISFIDNNDNQYDGNISYIKFKKFYTFLITPTHFYKCKKDKNKKIVEFMNIDKIRNSNNYMKQLIDEINNIIIKNNGIDVLKNKIQNV